MNLNKPTHLDVLHIVLLHDMKAHSMLKKDWFRSCGTGTAHRQQYSWYA